MLAGRAKINLATLARAEGTDKEPPITTAHAEAVRRALEKAGVEFVSEGDDGSGVRLRTSEK